MNPIGVDEVKAFVAKHEATAGIIIIVDHKKIERATYGTTAGSKQFAAEFADKACSEYEDGEVIRYDFRELSAAVACEAIEKLVNVVHRLHLQALRAGSLPEALVAEVQAALEIAGKVVPHA